MKISEEIIGALSGLALLWSIGAMVKIQFFDKYDANGNLMEREEQVFDDPYTRRYNGLDRTARVIYFVLGVLEILLAVRFIFRLLGADTSNGFANFIFHFLHKLVIFLKPDFMNLFALIAFI